MSSSGLNRDLFGSFDNDILFANAVALGYKPGWTTFRKFGMNPDVDAGIEMVWPPGVLQVLPSAAAVISAVSTSVNDDFAGTGAQQITFVGLDTDHNEIEETLDMDGTTPVVSTKLFLRCFRAYVALAGTGQANAGDISCSISGDLQCFIELGEGQTHCTSYTVPAGYILLLDYYLINSGRQANSDLAIRFQIMMQGQNSWRTLSDVFPYEGMFVIDQPRIVVPEKTESRVLTSGDAVNANASVEYSGYKIRFADLPNGSSFDGPAD